MGNPTDIIFKLGALKDLRQFVHRYERIVLITTSGFRTRGIVDIVAGALGRRLIYVIDDVQPNPNILTVDTQLNRLHPIRPDALIALGGGSSIDTAKTLARMLVQPINISLLEYFRDQLILCKKKALPVIAIPTTAGTGSEVTPFGTIWDFELGKKYSVTGEDIFPTMAILDPELTYDLPEELTISSGLDVVSHALESIWNKGANPVTVALATESLARSLPALRALKYNYKDYSARVEIMQASLLAGLAISKTRTALAHSISYPLTTDFGLPHGIACSFTLPTLLIFNLSIDDGRLEKLASSICNNSPQFLANEIEDLIRVVGLGKIFHKYIPQPEMVINLVDRMVTPERAGNNIREANKDDVKDIILDSLLVTGN